MYTTINPENVKEIKIKGAKFTLGIIPYQKFLELQSTIRQSIKEEKVGIVNMCKANIDFVKWGVKGHSDIQFEDGKNVPFKTD